MAQIGIPYKLIGPDGTIAVFNNPSDPDFIGYLDGDDGVTGLDGAEVRESAEERVEGDGGIHGNFFEGRRPITMKGHIWPEPDPLTVNSREQKLKRASRALTADAVLYWTQDGRVETRLFLRRQQKPAITGRRPKAWQLAMISADHRVMSSSENSLVILATGTAEASGRSYPRTYDYSYGGGVSVGQGTVVNSGDIASPPRFRIDGPITNPTIRNNTTGQEIRLVFTLAAGEYLIVDVADHSVKLGGTSNRYSAFGFLNSIWWELQAGSNDVRLLGTAYSSPAGVTVYWRHAWQ